MEELINKLSKEEKKAIEHFKNYPINWELTYEVNKMAIETILNLIEKQQEQLQEKDKLIKAIVADIEEHMSEEVCNYLYICDECKSNNEDCHGDYCKEAIIEYFTKKAREV